MELNGKEEAKLELQFLPFADETLTTIYLEKSS